jgi:hypothetical protein
LLFTEFFQNIKNFYHEFNVFVISIASLVAIVIAFITSAVAYGVLDKYLKEFFLKKDFTDIVPITTGDAYWTSSSSVDEQHGQVCCRVEDKIVSRHVLKSEKHHVTLVRKF